METWKDIPSFENYYMASNHGRIKSINRKDRLGRNYKGKILKPGIHKDGRLYVHLFRGDAKQCYYKVHRLILMTFIGECPDGMECLHLDNNPTNNNIDNLKWGTHKENQKQMSIDGRCVVPKQRKGEENNKAKLKENDVIRIKTIHKNTKVYRGYWRKLSNALGVTPPAIFSIIYNRTWRHIDI